jgi:S-methylmethionine-dependent homocysteine/selenocysteine methylase
MTQPATQAASSRFRRRLPQLEGGAFLTDSGLETHLADRGIALTDFAAFPLLEDPTGVAALRQYYTEHAALAEEHRFGMVLETPTWRASSDWGTGLGYDARDLARLNRHAVDLLVQVRAALSPAAAPVVVSGNLGPRQDGYVADRLMSAAEAQDYHAPQVEAFASSPADLVTAVTVDYPAEAVGIVGAARDVGMPVVISFTLGADAALPDGTTLGEAVGAVDDATGAAVSYYMVNCVQPGGIGPALAAGGEWRARLRGVRANAVGEPLDFAAHVHRLREGHPELTVLGGCCGTDVRHIRALAHSSR